MFRVPSSGAGLCSGRPGPKAVPARPATLFASFPSYQRRRIETKEPLDKINLKVR
ncbi:MAG: hypothetical protein HSCHL_0652 [Hydrogenibacillus schlegelii]|uniref:Uncharacterized protein n=1 Tax=Hydrogenibacillus schlegelii TaxID=1484 RepID=A0A2T5G808_HYDSH|nr:MAG: hypothetical protein HSCHL_0652 [Hydrogenibacillus schlegelii]